MPLIGLIDLEASWKTEDKRGAVNKNKRAFCRSNLKYL